MKTPILQSILAIALGAAAHAAPLKVYILAGQSNMQGHASVTTFDYMAKDPKTAPLLAKMRDSKGDPIVCDRVWISSLSEDQPPFPPPPVFAAYFAEATKARKATTGRPVRPPALSTAFTQKANS